MSHRANKRSKTLFHLAAIGSIRISGELRDYYEHQVEAGKNKMSLVNVMRNKLILRVFACVRDNRPHQKNYIHAIA